MHIPMHLSLGGKIVEKMFFLLELFSFANPQGISTLLQEDAQRAFIRSKYWLQ